MHHIVYVHSLCILMMTCMITLDRFYSISVTNHHTCPLHFARLSLFLPTRERLLHAVGGACAVRSSVNGHRTSAVVPDCEIPAQRPGKQRDPRYLGLQNSSRSAGCGSRSRDNSEYTRGAPLQQHRTKIFGLVRTKYTSWIHVSVSVAHVAASRFSFSSCLLGR